MLRQDVFKNDYSILQSKGKFDYKNESFSKLTKMNRHLFIVLLVISVLWINVKARNTGGTGGSGFVKGVFGDKFFGTLGGVSSIHSNDMNRFLCSQGNGGKGGSIFGDPNGTGGTGGRG